MTSFVNMTNVHFIIFGKHHYLIPFSETFIFKMNLFTNNI